MVDYNDPEQLKALMEQYHSTLNPDIPVSTTPDDIAEASRTDQFLAHQASNADKPLGTLGDVIDKSKLQASVKPDVAPEVVQGDPMPSAQELASTPSKGASVAGDTIAGSMPSSADKAMEATVDANAVKSASTGSSFLDNLLAKIPRERINSILGKKLFETEGAESAGLDLLKAGSKKEALQAGTKLLGAGTDAAISSGGQLGLKGLSLLGRAVGPLSGADLASSALANGDTSPEQRDYQQGVSQNEAKELGLPDSAAQGKDPGRGIDLLNIPGSFDNTKLSPEEQAQVDKFNQLLEAKKKAGMLPYQNPDESMVQDAGNKDKSLFDMVHNQYQTQQAQGNVGNSTSSSGGKVLGKSDSDSDDGDTPSRAPAVENPKLQGPSITDQFSQAQSAANMGALTAQLGKAGALIGSGIGAGITKPTTIDDKIFDTNLAISQQIPQQFLQKLEVSKLDPASDMSQAARDFLQKSIGITVPDNISAAQLKEQFPVIEKLLAARENAKTRQFMAMENLKMRQAALEMQNQHFEKNFDLRETNTGLRGINNIQKHPVVVQSQKRLQNLDKALQMIDESGVLSPQLLSDTEQDILAASTGAASPAVGKLNKIEQRSAVRSLAVLAQYMSPDGSPIDMRKVAPETVKQIRNGILLMRKGYQIDQANLIDVLSRQQMPLYANSPKITGALGQLAGDAKAQVAAPNPAPPASLATPSAPTSGLVKIRRKKDGVVKTIPAANAQQYLSDPGFEKAD